MQKFKRAWRAIENAHAPGVDDLPHGVQLGAVELPLVLAVLQHLVFPHAHLKVFSVNKPEPEIIDRGKK